MIIKLIKKIFNNPIHFFKLLKRAHFNTLLKALKEESFTTIIDNFYSLIFEESKQAKKNRYYQYYLKKWNKRESAIYKNLIGKINDLNTDAICILNIDFGGSNESNELFQTWISQLGFSVAHKTILYLGNPKQLKNEISQIKEPYIFLYNENLEFSQIAVLEILQEIKNSIDVSFDLIYADHDYKDGYKRYNYQFKPDWNPFLILAQNYIHFPICISKDFLQYHWIFEDSFNEYFHYDLILQISRRKQKMLHISKILYSVLKKENDSDPFKAVAQDEKTINSHLELINPNVRAIKHPKVPIFCLSSNLSSCPKVSIIVPFCNQYNYLKICINSILACTSYPNYELILINNNSDDPEVISYLETLKEKENIHCYEYNKVFNYSAINNFAVRKTNSPYLLFLNNDTKVIQEDWIEQMLGIFSFENVGAVGAKLLYEDQSVQHAGVILGMGHAAGHIFRTLSKNDPNTYMHRLHCIQNYSAVTAACLMTKRVYFDEVQGFDEENLKISYNDVDYCLKLGKLGKHIVYQPSVTLYHYESKSRNYDLSKTEKDRFESEIKYLKSSWNSLIKQDPFYNINLSKEVTDIIVKN